jgi:cysteine-S-conjugate beta-lyase
MDEQYKPGTRLLRAGRPHRGWINTPVTRASTYIYDSVAQWRDTRARRDKERLLSYGARGTDSTHALEDALVELEGGYRAKAYPTGQAAIAVVLLAYLKAGDHVLITDAVYEPVRRFCSEQLSRWGIAYSYYQPDGSDLADRIRPTTRMIYAECPGSLVYEMMDLPAVAELARRHDCWLAVDNTWGSGLLYRPLALGADISVCAATKYLGGHADVMMGTVVTNERAWAPLERATVDMCCAACVPCRRGWPCTNAMRCASPNGCRSGRKSRGCCPPPCPIIPAMRCGSGIAAAPMACFPSNSPAASRMPTSSG